MGFSKARKQIVTLNEKYSQWINVKGGVQSSIFARLLFLIHINDLSENLASYLKLFPDETLLFCIVKD